MKSTDRIVVYAGTRNLYHHMVTAAKSLLYHNGADHVFFLVEDDTFPEQLPLCVTCINVANQQCFDSNGPNYHSMWTYMALMRCAIPKLFPNFDRVLSLDVDTIVRKPIDHLWSLDLGNNFYACVEEKQITHRTHPYFNFGVVVHNVKLLREEQMDDVIIRTINSVPLQYPEQDAVNSACKHRITPLQPEYNVTHFSLPPVPDEHVIIRHYADTRGTPLDSHEDYQLYASMTWDHVLHHKEGEHT